jgi:hypothetical protein
LALLGGLFTGAQDAISKEDLTDVQPRRGEQAGECGTYRSGLGKSCLLSRGLTDHYHRGVDRPSVADLGFVGMNTYRVLGVIWVSTTVFAVIGLTCIHS